MGQAGRKWVRWSKERRDQFLDRLAASCNVKEAAGAAEVDPVCVYNLRRRDPGFVAEWDAALRLGYQMLETRLVGHALAGKGRGDAIADDGLEPLDVDVALRLLAAHRNAMQGKPFRGGPRRQVATAEETDAALMAKLDALERRLQRDGQ